MLNSWGNGILKSLLYGIAIAAGGNAAGQRFPFTRFDTDKGLAQSQVQGITQDGQQHLWIATFNGVDRFDGKNFTHYSKANGLSSGTVTAIATDAAGRIWMGTLNGITAYDGQKMMNYPVAVPDTAFLFAAITCDSDHHIYALDIAKGLFQLSGKRFEPLPGPVAGRPVTAMTTDGDGGLLVNVHRRGIYRYARQQWTFYAATDSTSRGVFIFRMACLGNRLFTLTNTNRLTAYIAAVPAFRAVLPVINSKSLCIINDTTIWAGTDKGVYACSPELRIRQVFNDKTGLTSNSINTLYKDAAGNVWAGSDGEGLFRYTASCFTHYDKQHGLPGNIVMGLGRDKKNGIFLAIREGGLARYDPATQVVSPVDYSRFSNYGFNCAASDTAGRLWLGTLDGKLLRYNGRTFTRIPLKPDGVFVNSIFFDAQGTGWLATTAGCYVVNRDTAAALPGFTQLSKSVIPWDKQTMLAATINGLYRLRINGTAQKINTPLPADIDANCLASYGSCLLIGTMQQGLCAWDTVTGKSFACTVANGLADNQVYSILIDRRNRIWCGTGRAVQEVVLTANGFQVKKFTVADGYLNAENNLNAILEDQKGSIWFGTTHGAFVYDHTQARATMTRPFVVIKAVRSDGQPPDTAWYTGVSAWNHLPQSLRLPYHHRDIGFSFLGVHLSDPGAVAYRYKLEGQDTGFSPLTEQAEVQYKNLEPGNYTFLVQAIAADGTPSANTADFTFSIATPFVKTTAFRLLLLLLLLLTGVGLQRYLTARKARKQRALERMRKEEQLIIRQKTAEDFHDEMGNKLTRITVLADILEKKMGNAGAAQYALVQQIRDNARQLYSGTRDILWTLEPGNDNLYETCRRICETGNELFQHTAIVFNCEIPPPVCRDTFFPIDYSRNLIMILKEGMTNVLRHAEATRVTLSVTTAATGFVFTLQDDGKGFETDAVQKGKGLHNLRNRAARIHALLTIVSDKGGGTCLQVTVKRP